jgi:Mg2+ and Co2+ transporter CorA
LEWEFAYPAFWMAVLAIFLLMFAWFKHKKWF